MSKKRKCVFPTSKPAKRLNVGKNESAINENHIVNHPVLRHYYEKVVSLREYLLSCLDPSCSQLARKLTTLGSQSRDQLDFLCLLDSVIVGAATSPSLRQTRAGDIAEFSQQLPTSTLGSNADPDASLQLEVIDFIIWILFKRLPSGAKSQHLLCYGFERASAAGQNGLILSAAAGIPGIVCHYPNPHVQTLTSPTWCKLLSILGRGGDLIMIDLLLDCGIFAPAQDGNHSLYQISGRALPAVPILKSLPLLEMPNSDLTNEPASKKPKVQSDTSVRKPSEIRFVRSRMFYAKPSTNARGNVRLGLQHIHVFNRYSDLRSEIETIHVMKYIFPRQFRLHNVFTCKIDHRETAQAFKDYTIREAEFKAITAEKEARRFDKESDQADKLRFSLRELPKRLKGRPMQLISTIRKCHQKCSYVEMLRYYCSATPEHTFDSEFDHNDTAATDLATPVANVSAFCRAVIRKVVPKNCWGEDEPGIENERIFMKSVDRFVQSRKFESLTLHEVLDGLKLADIPWLSQEGQQSNKMSLSDFSKRKEIFAELLYYLFDSFLIPLIRSNFHVTESNIHRNRLFYFRHDVWRTISEPAMAGLQGTMFEELDTEKARERLSSRMFGFSYVRLLPKSRGFRPITNLRRRPQYWQNGKRVLGRSINSVMGPVFRVLNYEKSTHPLDLGGSLFSVGDVYPKLKKFAATLIQAGLKEKPLFFAKVDVQACFDTVPQKNLVDVITNLLSSESYHINQHAEVKPPDGASQEKFTRPKAMVKFHAHAIPGDQLPNPPQTVFLEDQSEQGNSIFVGPLAQQSHQRWKVLSLLKEHVEFNIVKIGKKYFRQKKGIPQGSVLSSLLCNFFYGKLESEVLRLVGRHDTILLRLIDDFLLITTERPLAEAFLRTMHQGIPKYGISVKAEKSLVNFDCTISGLRLPRSDGPSFPYCGMSINTLTLNIKKSMERKTKLNVSDALTVEYASLPGRTFRRKALNGLKIQLHGMYFDTSFNSSKTAFENLYIAFHDAALRCFHYLKSLPPSNQPSFAYLKETILDLIKLAHAMIKKRRVRRKEIWKSYDCAVRKSQTEWLAYSAFNDVFQRKQTKYRPLLDWLTGEMAQRRDIQVEAAGLQRVDATL